VLVLSRSVGERIVIGEDVVVTVLMVSGGSVRLGIEAPRDIVVNRAEVLAMREATAVEPDSPDPVGSPRADDESRRS
jgi:carbon storage regulator